MQVGWLTAGFTLTMRTELTDMMVVGDHGSPPDFQNGQTDKRIERKLQSDLGNSGKYNTRHVLCFVDVVPSTEHRAIREQREGGI